MKARGFTLTEGIVLLAIIAVLAVIAAPMIRKNLKKGPFVKALGNSKQLHLALMEFDKDYGSFPDDSTLPRVRESTRSPLLRSSEGRFSNDYFRQLLAAGLGNELIFQAKAAGTRRGDDVFTTPENTLEAGEVGFAYLMNGRKAFSSTNSPGIVVLTTPLQEHSDQLFDSEPFGGKAVILRADGSASEQKITPTGELSFGGKTLLQTGQDTVWGTEIVPRLVPPERLRKSDR